MTKTHLPFNRPLFAPNAFFSQKVFGSHSHTAGVNTQPTTAQGDTTATHATTGTQGQGRGNQAPFEPYTQFNTNHKPDPVSFYARYGITLKGKQTNVKCCFHGDKTPSLSINKDTGAFYCFGCGVSGGDVIDFYQRYHGCDFVTACQDLNITQK
ncbi:CHC2 zinc finger domain-containing protein [Moraxella bovis]|uniref:CHC2 zinc finger domain-containing protein n=1 Tax=Moraxella bovis TaxID=476 RepID=UPI002225C083|nr:CHC2 zinc finger domain-containing protein [Moraxella bovis]UYZ69164.1 CHC2 zinc finger domain-containing protein [Moraxella bovis]UYZ71537.1 CHC2 zinc finger domain-containing protein [Moraxella bovis]UYZ72549.1 CHC2 zinc finger domain-containing protein [Moraxella bovis]UZA14832.1 CHC2 zinc finger domain-containing protein [Moraxella bovis]UZA26806.1 CHC2 zinc finger domain-containing protein [Moraxella bovis]